MHSSRTMPAILLFAVTALSAGPCCCAQDGPVETPSASEELEFAFEGAPWRDVVKWLADSDDLALHITDLPTGSFTYSDGARYTTQAAIDRVNLFLLPQGFTIVQSGRLLSLINLQDRQSQQQLDSLARLVSKDEIAKLPPNEVIKCLFELGELDAADAVEELSALNLMTQPAVFPRTNRIMVTDTAAKLRSAALVLSSFEPRKLDNGTVVKSFALEHVEAEDILVVARPHLGLATGEMIGIDVSLSSDVKGENLFVTGVDDKVKLIENLVLAIDRPKSDSLLSSGKQELRSYVIEGGNLQTVYNVLLTVLAGKEEMRLSTDEAAGSIVALATPETHEEIAATVAKLKADETEFEIIPLKKVDPYFAISLLEQMLELDASDDEDDYTPWWERDRWDSGDDDKGSVDPPKVDADPANRRLFVRGRRYQIEEIKKIVAGLDEGTVGPGESAEKLRIFPLKGPRAEQVLRTAARFWKQPNPVFFYPDGEEQTQPTERVINDQPPTSDNGSGRPTTSTSGSSGNSGVMLTRTRLSQAAEIRCQIMARGLLLQSEDTEALDEFESLLRTLSGTADSSPSPPVTFYMKYTRASDAIHMLAELLDGGEAAREAEESSLVNGIVTNSNSLLSSLITAREGVMTLISGSITVVADTRLNRMIVQGTAEEVELIEGYLEIIDRDSSLTEIETYGTSHIVELSYAQATEVAEAIREAYGARISDGKGAGASGGSQGGRTDDRDDDRKNDKRAPRPTPGQAARDLEPKMTVTVHVPSNSLVVTAPDALFAEVQKLAILLDERSRQTVRILNVPDAIPLEYLQQVLSNEPGRINISSGSTQKSKPRK
ncbi:MAG: hypothetical protein NXI04_24890 [Planctomycetaceae bacterium]|nr:hypothetical protein [Planctomycetaceae bacterium]